MEDRKEEIFTKLALFLSKEERIEIFEELRYDSKIGYKLPEEIAELICVKKTNVYRYMPKSESKSGGRMPDEGVTARMLIALADNLKFPGVTFGFLDTAEERMEETLKLYKKIKKQLYQF